ncbi:MAG: pilus assembly protein PilB [Planctomycetes bacterium DG_20]|nr:MAG: pilus assembly protein PilB [Planctomycetes bacterium DG_20]
MPVQLREPLGQILVGMGLVSQDQVEEALRRQEETGQPIGQTLIDLGYLTQADVVKALGAQFGMDVVNLAKMDIPPDVVEKVPVSMASAYKIMPVGFEDNVLTVAMADPLNFKALDDLHFLLSYEIRGAISNAEAVEAAHERYYSGEEESMEDIFAQLDREIGVRMPSSSAESIDLESIEELAEAAPVRRLLSLVLLQAIKERASDIHFEPFEDEFKMRYRIDGALYEMIPPPRHLSLAIISRIKVMANLNIAERRLPQDGRIPLNIGGNPVELRVSVLPTAYGESVVMRVLDRSVVSLDLRQLGMLEEEVDLTRNLIFRPNGIVLVTGPTGCGKTTTLYAALEEANDIGTKIVTTEDPVEYDLDGIIQIQIRPEIGLNFASCLRHILRHDPDKILVGEIRDLETAQIAIQASLTGHVVFSTLHTNDAPSAITRMMEIGVEPYLITATCQAVIAQRLVRKICVHCREEYQPTEEALMELGLTPDDVKGRTFYRGRGCDRCNNVGYRGRTGIFEFMMMDDAVRDVILAQGSLVQLRTEARRRGMRTMRESGLRAIFDGVTTISEVVHATVFED